MFKNHKTFLIPYFAIKTTTWISKNTDYSQNLQSFKTVTSLANRMGGRR